MSPMRSMVVAAACLVPWVAVTARAGAPSNQCDAESVQAMAPADTTVAFAAREGELCRVVGFVTTRDPGPNKVLFTLGLPNDFSGRYIYLGVGGAAGALPALRPELITRGFAVAGGDAGTGAKNAADFSFKSDSARLTDFLGRGVHVVAQATEQITRTYYSQPTIHRYISGCSGGGSMGMTNAMRFGRQDFDGFVVGATPWLGHTAYMENVFRLEQYLQLHPQAWISPELLKKADAAILAAYDGSDGALDGIIADQRNIKDFNIDILRGVGFTPAQITMFDLVRKPATFALPAGGQATQPGWSITSVASWSQFLFGSSPPPWPSTQNQSAEALLAEGAPFFHVMVDTDTRALRPGQDYAQIKDPLELTRLAIATGGSNNDIPDPDAAFTRVARSGAKIVFFQGVSDQANSYLGGLQAYDEVSRQHADVANWLRVFVIPGLMHCRGGPGPTDAEDPLIDAVVRWVEQDQAPDSIIASRITPIKGLERTFRVCAEPARAFLRKPDDDPTKAENWECRIPNH